MAVAMGSMDTVLYAVVAAVGALLLWLWWSRKPALPAAKPTKARTEEADKRRGRRRGRAKRLADNTANKRALSEIPRVQFEEHDELDITKVTVMSDDELRDGPEAETLRIDTGEQTTARVRKDPEQDTKQFERGVIPIIYDDDASEEQPTSVRAYILLSAGGQTDPGLRRRKNEDYFAIIEDPNLYIVADGMGGHVGGELASAMAVETIRATFNKGEFDEGLFEGLPRRGREVVEAIQLANRRIHDKALAREELEGMGTTVVCARFSPLTQRVYIGHVGDSRCYRVRAGEMHQLTSDHNVAAHGFKGPIASHLTRALGIRPTVTVDLMIGKPEPGDRYVLCSDGLSKMVDDDTILAEVVAHDDPESAVARLIGLANEAGGKDNTTVIVVFVEPARV